MIASEAIIYIGFGQYCVIAWGDALSTPLITDQLDHNTITYIVKVLFCFNLVFSFPLMLYPSNIIVENYLYKGWPKSKKRQMYKNLDRVVMVFLVIGMTILLKDKLDKFLAILGALACTPIAFSLPAAFHYKACAETKKDKYIDLAILVFAIIVQAYCTVMGFINW